LVIVYLIIKIIIDVMIASNAINDT